MQTRRSSVLKTRSGASMAPKAFSIAGVAAVAATLLIAASVAPARAEVIEEIVARVNDDVVTRSDLQQAEQQTMEEIYSKNAGEALDKELAQAKVDLLKDLITRRLLVQQAERIYDIPKMQDAFIRQFKEQQKITSNSELEKMLKDEDLTLEEFKKKLVEINAPGSVIDFEVRDKVSVSDAEIEKYYRDHVKDLSTPERVSFKEIVLAVTDDRPLEDTLARGRSLAARAREGEAFDEIARQSSQVEESLRGKLLGPFTRGELAGPLEEKAFSMKPGEISEPVRVGDTVHVIRLEGREEMVTPSLDSTREKISGTVEREKFQAALNAYFEDLWKRSDIHVADEYMQRLPPDYRKYVK